MQKVVCLVIILIASMCFTGCSDNIQIANNEIELANKTIESLFSNLSNEKMLDDLIEKATSEEYKELVSSLGGLAIDVIKSIDCEIKTSKEDRDAYILNTKLEYKDCSKIIQSLIKDAVNDSVKTIINNNSNIEIMDVIRSSLVGSINNNIDVNKLPLKNRDLTFKLMKDTGDIVIDKEIIHILTGDSFKILETTGMVKLQDIVIKKETVIKLINNK